MQLAPYLTFNGNCREAMLFYKECLGGNLYFQTLGDSPLTEKMPHALKERILHAALTTENFTIMATDLTPDNGLTEGNSVALILMFKNEKELTHCFEKLADKQQNQRKPELNSLGILIGNLTDKFGKNWLLHCQI
jgi:PhnB protein